MVIMWILGFGLLGSFGAIGGAGLFLLFPKSVRERLVPFLVSYATGTLLGASLLGLLPRAIEQGGLLPGLGAVLAGLIVFFVLERFLIWRHCHREGSCEVHGTTGQLILVGDALHNFVDGAVIAAAFMSSVPLGIATGIAVIAHELPQEVGDFAILLDNGFSPRRALTWNLVSGSTTIPGALLAYIGLQQAPQFNATILALSAASFLYIGLADLVPGLHRRIGAETGLGQLFLILAGIGTILLLHMHYN
ncbi:MAG: ZIP family metal transporter [Nitrospiraceae bacterium]|nr:MAG: ZIP family metal transporter [Nitrospiraceae bacterium]